MRLCIVCGGRSAEHEVSLLSAKNVIAAADPAKFDVTVVGIDKQGTWHLYAPESFLCHPDDPTRISLAKPLADVALVSMKGKAALVRLGGRGRAIPVDVVFPVLHGTYGEDGAIQGLIRMANVPCVGCGVASSANCMDKEITKQVLVHAGVPVARFVIAAAHEQDTFDTDDAIRRLGLPLFVKPARLGSSVGVAKCHSSSELRNALTDAFRYDTKVLLEEFVQGREIECAVLGNERPRASVPGEVIPRRDFYSYAAKYLDADGAELRAPADLDLPTVARVQQLALRTYKAMQCSGMARVDMFLRADGSLVINELNTIPGFTKISMYPRLWNLSGIPYPALIEELVNLAIASFQTEAALLTDYHAQ
ncbi:MAG: D-alanine--D-alanine ligase A [Lentisphaerae bacterium RIFOXYB12_FULL_65_16]|nr:MAG: D-alanine--D-alanine ligase A [Lentisphaerae bacterium RIFOXYA12_64_32]OGV87298.1 MAG: D-alanine--D-alanine ligase A [Lentisphaerae bacterium RIFOXYB12_FULL_65_16]